MFGARGINKCSGASLGGRNGIARAINKSRLFRGYLPNANGAANRAQMRGAAILWANCAARAAGSGGESVRLAQPSWRECPAKGAIARVLIAARGS